MMNEQLERERIEHNEIYDRQQSWILAEAVTWERYYQHMSRPPHEGGTLYGLDHQIFLDYLQRTVKASADLRVLDYGCGTGALGLALAERGLRVSGFDLSDRGIEIAQRAAVLSGLAERCHFVVANAQDLPFADNSFDFVVAKAVLHHTIKYPGTERELYRILKPGGKAIFFEGAASNPLISLARRFTIEEELGDVPLTIEGIQTFAESFSNVNIRGYFFCYMLKRLGYYASDESLPDRGRTRLGKTALFRTLLRLALAIDRALVNEKRTAWAGRYLIELTK